MKKIILLLLFLTTIVMVPAVNFTQEVIDSQRIDLDLGISSNQFFKITTPTRSVFNLDFDTSFRTRTVSRDSENFLTLSVGPDIYYNYTGSLDLDIEVAVEYGNQLYFTPDSTFPVGLEIASDIYAGYLYDSDDPDDTGLDLDAGLYLAFLGGRIVDQGLLLNAKNLSDSLKADVSDDVLREIAQLIASFYELSGSESDLQIEQFASGLASLLGMTGHELRVYNAYRQVLEHRSTRVGRGQEAYTGFQFKIGFQTDFDLETSKLKVATLPELTFAGNFGDAIWFDLHGAIDLPTVDYTFGGPAPDMFILNQMDGAISADLNWYISPVLSLNFGNNARFINFMSDPVDPATPTPTIRIGSRLALEYDVNDSFKLEFEMPVDLAPDFAVDFAIYATWDIL